MSTKKIDNVSDLNVKADKAGEISGYASTYNTTDRANEIVMPGAFDDTIKRFKSGALSIPLMDNHQLFGGTESVLGKLVELKSDSVGLWFRAQLSSTPLAQQVRTKIQEGLLQSLSIGYQILKDQLRGDGVRLLKALALREVSVVVFPANEEARIVGVKNLAASQARISAAQLNQAIKDLDFLEMRAKELERKERYLAMLEQLAAQQGKPMTPTQLGFVI